MSELHYNKPLYIDIKTPTGEVIPAEFIHQSDYHDDVYGLTSGKYDLKIPASLCGKTWTTDPSDDDAFHLDGCNLTEWLGAAILESHAMHETSYDGFSYKVKNPEDYNGENVELAGMVFGDMHALSKIKASGELDYQNLNDVVIATSSDDAEIISAAYPSLPKILFVESDPGKAALLENNKNISQKVFKAGVIEHARARHIKSDDAVPRKLIEGVIETIPSLSSQEKREFKSHADRFDSFSEWLSDIEHMLSIEPLANIKQLTTSSALKEFKIVNNTDILDSVPFVCAQSAIKEKEVLLQGEAGVAYYIKEPNIVDPDAGAEEFLCLAVPSDNNPGKSKLYTSRYIENEIDSKPSLEIKQEAPNLKPKR